HHFAALAADDGRPELPFDLIEGIDSCFRKKPRERQARRSTLFAARLVCFACCGCCHWHVRRPTAFNCLLAGASGFHGSAIFHVDPAPFTPALPGIGDGYPGSWCNGGDRQVLLIASAAGDRESRAQRHIGSPAIGQEAGRIPADRLVALRRVNMRPTATFVNSRPTRYCGSLLGQTQDVDACVSLWT